MNSELIDEPSAPADKVPPKWYRRWLLWLLLIAAVVLLVTGYIAYAKLTGNLRYIEVSREDLGDVRPAKLPNTGLNILVVGLDQSTSENSQHIGDRTDTIMLAHLSPERNNAVVISFPRDSMVQLPACRVREEFPGQKRHLGIINSSFSFGGIGCTWKTIETLTGIRIDHFIMVDFAGFKNMVDAIGGVDFCIPEPIHDEYVPLTLPAGWQTLLGEQALGYVRARHSIGDGSDIGRIQRQQDFVAAIAKKSMSRKILANPILLFSFLDAVTKSVITDPGLTIGVMRHLALTALSMDTIHFVITPWRYSTAYPGRVEWRERPARKLFQLISADHPVSDALSTSSKTAEPLRSRTDAEPVVDNDEPVTTPTAPCFPAQAN
ncbi:LCP family protein [Phyllobacterium sp. P30BS-XVII]|uniref:LCP family glycopolymer transferase n=1 Tax=Phyllobacterium sp. P30BS-XVII TaxID=2587046 RepID=UPI00179A116B|nr:LCP family protein required for cell wall assembly [Phyllobacterium sp. P30BS-XVII]